MRRWEPTWEGYASGSIAVIDGSDAVVATRYRGVPFSFFRGRPTIGICYQSKSRRLLEMAGTGEYAVEAESLNANAYSIG